MKAVLMSAALAICTLGFIGTAHGQEAVATPQQEIAELKKQVEVLKAEVARLTQENQLLRSMLTATQATPAATGVQSSPAKQVSTQVTEQKETGYWMTLSSGKRHNRSCRYYRNSNGRFCTKDEGIPCKICGG